MYPVRAELDRQDAARQKRESSRLREQARWYRRWLVGYAGEETLRLLEESAPGVFPSTQEHLDKMA